MIFITDNPNLQTKQWLDDYKHSTLILKNRKGNQLARFVAPKHGWTPWDLWQLRQQLPPQWINQHVDAYLGGRLIGSNYRKEQDLCHQTASYSH